MLEKVIEYHQGDVHLWLIEEDQMLWLTAQQMMVLFSCTNGKMQLMLQNTRRIYPSVYEFTMRKIPLVLQEKNAFSKTLRETVRCIQHYNYRMVELLLDEKDTTFAQDFLNWYHMQDFTTTESTSDDN